jgi:hypothetical protein
MSIRTTAQSLELEVVHPIFRTETQYQRMPEGDEFPEQVQVLDRELRIRKWFRKDGITSVEQAVSDKHKIYKTRCVVFDRYSGRFYQAYHSIDDVMATLEGAPPKTNQIGFIHHDPTIYPRRPQIHEHKKGR